MKKITYFVASLFFAGATLTAQNDPCSTFEDPSPQGNWYTEYCTDTYGNNDSFDGSQCVKLGDDAGPSWFKNKTDFTYLGERFRGKCLCFDYRLINDGDPNASNPVNPYIAVSDGVNTIYFQASTTVYEGDDWIHVCAPIEPCTDASGLASNSSGSWTYGSTTDCDGFNQVLYNAQWIGFFTDLTSYQTEEMWIDNVCIRDCEKEPDPPCTVKFDLSITFGMMTPNASVDVLLAAWYINSTYIVDWGDGSLPQTVGTPHTYMTPGTYVVCVSEYVREEFVCKRCVTFCYSGVKGGGLFERSIDNSAAPALNFTAPDEKKFMNEGFPLFPNPASDNTTLQLPRNKGGEATVKVYDMLGKVVAETKVKADNANRNINLNTGRLGEGIYTVEITVGGKVSTQKISIVK